LNDEEKVKYQSYWKRPMRHFMMDVPPFQNYLSAYACFIWNVCFIGQL